MNNASDAGIISRVARLLANLAKSPECISAMENDRPLIQSLVFYSSPPQNSKCRQACIRALRNICCSKQSAQMAVEDDKFPDLLSCLSVPQESQQTFPEDTDLVLSCGKLMCELLKTQAIEVGFRLVEESVLKSLFHLGDHPTSEEIRNLVLEIMFQLTVTTRCRVAVSTEGAIELFLKRIRQQDFNDSSHNTESFKCAIQGLCLCAREAVSRNLMKLSGALQEMVRVLKNSDFSVYREALVAAFVWFLFDDSSLGLLIRANVTPSLLDYLNKLTLSEYNQAIELNALISVFDPYYHQPDPEITTASSPDPYSNRNASTTEGSTSSRWMYPSSPESSPYNHYSPSSPNNHYSPSSPNNYNACSPSSLTYSPPHSPPMGPASPPDGYSDVFNESYGAGELSNSTRRKRIIPYHFQSADGIHAMIHGTRGPIHDTLLLLSRFSQAKDPSSFFLYLPGFNSLLNHVSLSVKSNPKCARLLNRLTSNSFCFDVLLKKNLIPRLYLRLCTGWSLEHLIVILDDARKEYFEQLDQSKKNTVDKTSTMAQNPDTGENSKIINDVISSKTNADEKLSTISITVETNLSGIEETSIKNNESYVSCTSNIVETDMINGVHHETSSTKNSECTAANFNTKNEKSNIDVECVSNSNNNSDSDDLDILYLLGHRGIPNEINRMGKLFLSNLQMQGQTAYGSGVLSKILSTGSEQLQETCLMSLPYIVW